MAVTPPRSGAEPAATEPESTDPAPELRVAIIGSGPSGFYAASSLFKSPEVEAHVDMFDRLPTPFGLVRGGVAPDHQKIKNVIRVYNKTAEHPRFRFFGNVCIGRDLSVAELGQHYHAIIFAVGNESDRRLGLPGEDLPGVHSATEFIGWYNGHPDFQDRSFDLSRAKRVAVIGNGNVAMDVARVLAQDTNELARTDITDAALEALRASAVEEIVLLGRRGPAQAAFSPKEIKEIGSLLDASLVLAQGEMDLDPISRAWLEDSAPPSARKNVEYLTEQSQQPPQDKARRVVCRFLVSPTEFLAATDSGDGDRLTGVRLERNELCADANGVPKARGTGETFDLAVDLVFKAVGYRGVPLEGVPFDQRWGVFPNRDGRIHDAELDTPSGGHYVVGWAKRGPSGLIGTNGPDSDATVRALIADVVAEFRDQGASNEGGGAFNRDLDSDSVVEALRTKGLDFVSFQDWQLLDALEIRRGENKGKIRDKFCGIDDMMQAIRTLRQG